MTRNVDSMFPEERIDEYSKRILEEKGKGAHTYDHTKRVLSICMEIGANMGANKRVLGAAALLHDIGRPFEKERGRSHSILSGEMSKEFLKEIGYSDSEIEQVINAIRTHRFSEGLEPTSLEGIILSDVDKLEAIGAIGIFRAVAQATVSGKGISGFLDHAEEKLLKLRDSLHTEQAKSIAKERHYLLEIFVNNLRGEMMF